MRLGLGIVTLVCLFSMSELIYFNLSNYVIIGLSLFAFLPYAFMLLGILFNKNVRRTLLGDDE